MGNADLVCCVLGHVLVGIKEYNARALARAAWSWTRVSRAHWDACRSATPLWVGVTRRHFGSGAATLVPNDARANFYALCRKAQQDHMGLPVFMRFDVEDVDTLAEAMLEHDRSVNYERGMVEDWRVRGWRSRYRIMARHVLRLLSRHPHGKYAHYDAKGMVAYFLGPRDIGPAGVAGEHPFENCEHKMATFLYPNGVTDWESFRNLEFVQAHGARKYLRAVRKMGNLLALFASECA